MSVGQALLTPGKRKCCASSAPFSLQDKRLSISLETGFLQNSGPGKEGDLQVAPEDSLQLHVWSAPRKISVYKIAFSPQH